MDLGPVNKAITLKSTPKKELYLKFYPTLCSMTITVEMTDFKRNNHTRTDTSSRMLDPLNWLPEEPI